MGNSKRWSGRREWRAERWSGCSRRSTTTTKKLSHHAFPASPTHTSLDDSTGIPSQRAYYLRPRIERFEQKEITVFKMSNLFSLGYGAPYLSSPSTGDAEVSRSSNSPTIVLSVLQNAVVALLIL